MSTERATPTRRPRASREEVVVAALDLLEREGLDALSIRRLAADVGLPPATLYGYFRDKDDLVDAVIDAGMERISTPRLSGPWRRRLRDLVRWLRGELLRRPYLIAARRERPLLSPGALRSTEVGMQILLDAGFSRAEAARAWRSLWELTFGNAAFGGRDGSEADARRTQAALLLLPPDEYPALSSSVAEAASAMVGEDQFEYALARLLDGLEGSLAKRRR